MSILIVIILSIYVSTSNLSSPAVIYLILSYAYFLVFHGSRDCRTQTAALNLKDLLIAKYQPKNILTQHNYLEKNHFGFASKLASSSIVVSQNQSPLIDIAALELAPRPLSDSLIDFASKAKERGLLHIKVIPLFLAPGVHVSSDIPAEIDLALAQLDNQVTIKLSPFFGKYSGIETLLAQKFAEFPAQKRILIAHGSRLPAVSEYYQNLAAKLNADVGYWSTEPKFTEQIQTCIDLGTKQIALLPYFLFPGKITKAIAAKIAELQHQYPQVELMQAQPLGATQAVADLIAQEI